MYPEQTKQLKKALQVVNSNRSVLIASSKFFETDDEDENTEWCDDLF